MNTIRQIIIGFSTPLNPSIFSRLIRFGENLFMNKHVGYSHVYLQFNWEGINRSIIFQTNKHGAHFIEHSRFLTHNKIVREYALPLDLEAFQAAMTECVDTAATAYGVLEIVGIGLTRIYNKWFNKRAKNPLGDGNTTYVCSALTAKVLEAAGLSVFGEYDWEYYGPVQVEQLLIALLSKTPVD